MAPIPSKSARPPGQTILLVNIGLLTYCALIIGAIGGYWLASRVCQ